MVKVEGPFTLLSPEETGRLRAMGVDLAHCRNWVVGGGGEALLAGIPGGYQTLNPSRIFLAFVFVWRRELYLVNAQGDGSVLHDRPERYEITRVACVRDLPADWYKARFGDVGELGEGVEPDGAMLRMLALLLRAYHRVCLSYGGLWPEGVGWDDVDRSGLKVREGGLVGPWDAPLTRYRWRVPTGEEYAYAAGLSPEGFAKRVRPGEGVTIDDAGRSVLWHVPVLHNPHGGGSGTHGGIVHDGVAYGWREVREAFARPVGERRMQARRVFFYRGNEWCTAGNALLRAYWDASNWHTFKEVVYRGKRF